MSYTKIDEDYYNVLEIPSTATNEEIKKSYRRLALLQHPDKNHHRPDATSLFQLLNRAYETLKDTTSRHLYDLEWPRIIAARAHHQAAVAVAEQLTAAFERDMRAAKAECQAGMARTARARAARREEMLACLAVEEEERERERVREFMRCRRRQQQQQMEQQQQRASTHSNFLPKRWAGECHHAYRDRVYGSLVYKQATLEEELKDLDVQMGRMQAALAKVRDGEAQETTAEPQNDRTRRSQQQEAERALRRDDRMKWETLLPSYERERKAAEERLAAVRARIADVEEEERARKVEEAQQQQQLDSDGDEEGQEGGERQSSLSDDASPPWKKPRASWYDRRAEEERRPRGGVQKASHWVPAPKRTNAKSTSRYRTRSRKSKEVEDEEEEDKENAARKGWEAATAARKRKAREAEEGAAFQAVKEERQEGETKCRRSRRKQATTMR